MFFATYHLPLTTSLHAAPWWQARFTDGNNSTTDNTILNEIRTFIQRATSSVYMANYSNSASANQQLVADDLTNQANAGLDVRYVGDGSEGCFPGIGGAVQCQLDGTGDIMHNKWIIRDYSVNNSTQRAMIMGSGNYTNGGWGTQDNSWLFVYSSAVIQNYTNEFLEMFGGTFHGGSATSPNPVGINFGVNGRTAYTLFQCEDRPWNTGSPVVNQVNSANESVFFQFTAYDRANSGDIVIHDQIINRINTAGILVEGVVNSMGGSAPTFSGTALTEYNNANREIRRSAVTSFDKHHHKHIIIDMDWIGVGSANMSKASGESACPAYDENLLFTNDFRMARAFMREFHRHYHIDPTVGSNDNTTPTPPEPHDDVAPNPPTAIVVNATTDTFTVNWTPPSNPGDFSRYYVYITTAYSTAGSMDTARTEVTEADGSFRASDLKPEVQVKGYSSTFAVVTTYNEDDLLPPNSTGYYIGVVAVDKWGNESTIAFTNCDGNGCDLIQDLIAPGAISNLTALVGVTEGTVRLQWTAPGDDGTTGSFTGTYEIKYSSAANIHSLNYSTGANTTIRFQSSIVPGLANFFTVTGLLPGVTYWFAIKTIDDNNNVSVWNSTRDVLTVNTSAYAFALDIVPPQISTPLVVGRGTSWVMLQWTKPAVDVSSYTIYFDTWNVNGNAQFAGDPGQVYTATYTLSNPPNAWSTGPITVVDSAQTIFYLVSGLEPNTTWFFAIRSGDESPGGSSIFVSSYSANDSTVTLNSFPPPATGFAGVVLSTQSINWSWWDPTNAEDFYTLRFSSNPSIAVSSALNANTTYWQETGLTPNTSYFRVVVATNLVGEGLPSNAATVYTLANPPTGFMVTQLFPTQMVLSWQANNNPPWTQYALSQSTDNFTVNISTKFDFGSNLTSTTITLGGLNPFTTYYFRLWAINGDGIRTSFVTAWSTTTTPITFFVVNLTSGSFVLGRTTSSILWGWTLMPNATGYQVKYGLDPTVNISSTFAAGTTTFLETDLGVNQPFYRLVAGKIALNEQLSNIATAYTLSRAPTNLTFTQVFQTTIAFSWNANGNPPGTRYGIALSTDGFVVSSITVRNFNSGFTGLTDFIGGLLPKTTYYIRVWAYNGEGIQTSFIEQSTVTAAINVFISEFSFEGTNDWVELYNDNDFTMNMAGWALQVRDVNGAVSTITFTGSALIPAKSFFLIVNAAASASGFTNFADLLASLNLTANGTIFLSTAVVNTDAISAGSASILPVVDRVGWSDVIPATPTVRAEGSAIVSAGDSFTSYERKAKFSSTASSMAPNGTDYLEPNIYDSDNNIFDFVKHTVAFRITGVPGQPQNVQNSFNQALSTPPAPTPPAPDTSRPSVGWWVVRFTDGFNDGYDSDYAISNAIENFVKVAESSVSVANFLVPVASEPIPTSLATALNDRAASLPSGAVRYVGNESPGGIYPNLSPTITQRLNSASDPEEMFNKFVVRDPGHPVKGAVLISPGDFTPLRWTWMDNSFLMLFSSQVAANYQNEFNEMFNGGFSGPVPAVPTTPNPILVQGTSVYTYFACEDGPWATGSKVDEVIRTANESVFFQTTRHDPLQIGYLAIDNAIRSHKSTSGFIVEGVVNSIGSKVLAFYNADGYEIRQAAVTSVTPSGEPKHQHKHLIIDLDWLGVGSIDANQEEAENQCIASNVLKAHDGNFVFINDFRLARAYMQEFHRKYHLDNGSGVGAQQNAGVNPLYPHGAPGSAEHNPPPSPANLNVTALGASSFTVSWSAPDLSGAGFDPNRFSRYYIYISTVYTTKEAMMAAYAEIQEPDGSFRSSDLKPEVQVKGLNSTSATVRTINENIALVPNSRGYFIGVTAVNKWGMESDLLFSAGPNGRGWALQKDAIPPAAISDLTALTHSGVEGAVRLAWTAPGDNGNAGDIVDGIYEIRYSSVNIINSTGITGSCPDATIPNWQGCVQIVSTNIVSGQQVGTIITGLQSDTSYYFAIRTQDEGEGNFALWNSFEDVAGVNTLAYVISGDTVPPSVATPFIIGTAPGWVYLSWTKPASDVEIYEIHYSTNPLQYSSGTFVFPGTSTVHVPSISPVTTLAKNPREANTIEFFVLTGLMDQTTYFISIRARDFGPNIFFSSFSFVQSTKTQLGPVIPPTNFAGASTETTSISWSWDDNSDMENQYLVQYATSRVTISGGVLAANTTKFLETGLLPNTSHFRVVVGSNAIGEGFPSSAVLRWTLARPPTGFRFVEVQPNRMRLIWETNQNPPYTRYGMSRSTNDFINFSSYAVTVSTFFNFASAITSNTVTVGGLNPGTTYFFRVWAFNGDAIETNFEVTFTTTTPSVTLTVSSLTTTSILWAWNPLIPTATGYQLKYTLDFNVDITTPLAAGTTNYLESNLSVNSVYRRVLAGQTPFGTNLSNSVTVYTRANAPTGLTLTGVFQTTVSFSWNSNGNPAGTRYGAAISTYSDFSQAVSTFINFASAHTALSASKDGLLPLTTYYLRVWAYNGDGVETDRIMVSTTTKGFALLISEFSFGSSPSGSGPVDDWVELYNDNDFALNLAGWALQMKSSTGTFTKIDLTGVIPAKGFYLVARDDPATNQGLKNIATQISSGLVLASDNGTIFITTDSVLLNSDTQTGSTVIDRVGWSNVIPASGSVAAEGTAIVSEGEGYSYERKASSNSTNFTMAPGGSDNALPNTYDSQNNQFDFVRHAISYRIPGIPGNPEGISDTLIPPPPSPATSGSWWTARFTDGNNSTFDTAIENEIESFVLEAKNKVYVANYSVPSASTKLTSAMNNRALAGVDVRYVGDGTEGAYPNLNNSVQVQLDPAGGQIMHNKFIIRDPDSETNRALLMGSGNFTPGGWGTQDNSFLIIRSSVIIQKYLEEFNEMWGNTFQGGTPTSGLPLTVNGRNTYTLFSCEDRPFLFGNPVDATIRAASESIFFETSGHDPANQGNLHLDDAILSRRTVSGFKVIEGVYNTMGQATLDRYNSQSDPLKVEVRQSAQTAFSKHHHKYIVIDMDWLGVGSVNPSKSSSENSCPNASDENFLLVNDFRLARAYMKEFHRHYHLDAVKGSADNTQVTPTRAHDDTPPVAPANLSVTALASSFTVSWSAPSDPGDFSRYYIYITTKYTTITAMDNGRTEITEIDGSFRSSELKPEAQVKNINVTTITITTFNEDFPLPPGSTSYFIGVAAVDFWGNESTLLFGGPFNLAADIVPPGAISNLTALSGTNEGEIRLQWSAPGNNGNSGFVTPGTYEIKYSSVGIITSTNYDNPPSPSSTTIFILDITPGLEQVVTITGLLPNTSYWFAIKTKDEAGNLSVWNSSADVATVNTLAYAEAKEVAPPAPATPFVIGRSISWVLLQWTKPAIDVTSYEIHYSTSNVWFSSGTPTAPGTSTVAGMNSPIAFPSTDEKPMFLVSGLTEGVTYFFSLVAIDAPPTVLRSSFSLLDSTFPASGLPPSATGFAGTALSTFSIMWSWSDVSDAERLYRVKYATSPTVSASGDLAENTTFWEQTGLTSNSSHFFVVVASNSFSEGPSSNSVLRWTLARAPTGFRFIEVQATSMKLTWERNENPSHTRYGMSRSTDNFTVNITTFFSFNSAITSNTVTVGGLFPQTTYFFRVWAFNGDAIETNFDFTTTTTTPNLVLSLVSRSTNSLTWAWSPLIPGATGYRLKYALDTSVNISTELAGNVTSYLETNLNVNEPYYRAVAALTNFGDNLSNPVTAYTLARTPVNLRFTGVFHTTITFAWDANNNPTGTRYGAAISTDNFTVNVTTFLNFDSFHTALTASRGGLTPQTTYFIRVWAYNGDKIETESIVVSTRTRTISVLISEFSFGADSGAGVVDDWVELFNDNDFDIDLSGWSLQRKKADGTYVVYLGTLTIIPAKSFYLIVNTNARQSLKDLADFLVVPSGGGSDWYPADHHTIFLVTHSILLTDLTATGAGVADRVGWSNAIPHHPNVLPEGSAIVSVGEGFSYERKAFENSVSTDLAPGGFHEFAANRYDSQNNFFDFVRHQQSYRIPGIPGLPQNSKNRFDLYHTTAVPQAPANFRGVAQSTDSIRWSWNDVTDETFYFVKFASNTGVNVSPPLVVNSTTYLETGLLPNTSYWRVAISSNPNGSSALSNAATVYTLAQAPGNFTILNVSPTSMTITWNANGNPVGTRYGVSRSTVNFGVAVTTFVTFDSEHTQTSVSIAPLQPATTYYLALWAYNGEKVESSQVFLATPTVPLVFVGTAVSPNSILWTWSLPAGTTAAGDTLLIKNGLDLAVAVSTSLLEGSTYYFEQGLSINNEYFRVVVASRPGVGEIFVSNIGRTFTLSTEPANILFSQVFTTSITFSWSNNGNPSGTRYGVASSSDNFSVNITTLADFSSGQSALSFSAGQLFSSTTYYFRVWAYNADGLASSFITGSTVTRALQSILISEFSFDSKAGAGGTQDDWVELFNPNEFDFDLSEVSLQLKSSTGGFNVILLAGGVIPSKGFYLVVSSAARQELRDIADLVTNSPAYYNLSLAGDHQTLFLVNGKSALTAATQAGPNILDRVGYSNAIPAHSQVVPEGTALNSATGEGTSFERKASSSSTAFLLQPGGADEFLANSYDSNNNFFDFVQHSGDFRIRGIPGLPQNSSNRSYLPHTSDLPPPATGFVGMAVSTSSIVWGWKDIVGESFYRVRDPDNSLVAVSSALSVNTTFFAEASLLPNRRYRRVVTVSNANGQSSLSNAATVYTLARQPSNLSFTGVTISSFILTWSANENPAGTRYGFSRSTLGFDVGLSTFMTFASTFTENSIAFSSGILPGTTYYFRVWSYNEDGIPSDPVTIATQTPPIIFRGTAASVSTILWSWNLPPGTTVAGDTLILKHGSDSSIELSTALAEGSTYYFETGLSPNAEYLRVLVASRPAVGEFFVTHPAKIYTLANAPTNFTLFELYDSTMVFSWSANGNPQGTRYGASISTDNFAVNISSFLVFGSTWIWTLESVEFNRLILKGLEPNTTYYLRIFAFNGNGLESLFLSTAVRTTPVPKILISEFSFNSDETAASQYDDWIELFNPNPFNVDLKGFSLQIKYQDGTYRMKTFVDANPGPEPVILPSSGYYLIVRDHANTNTALKNLADLRWDQLDLNEHHMTIFLARSTNVLNTFLETSDKVVDRVGYSNTLPAHAAVTAEGTALNSAGGMGKSFERKASSSSTNLTLQPGGAEDFFPNSYDTNENASDFVSHSGIFRIAGIPGLPQNSSDRYYLPHSTNAPPVPSNFTGTAVSTSSILWSWSDVVGESFYVVKFATNTQLNVSTALIVNTTSFLETNLLPNRQYLRVVVSSNSNGPSTLSNAATLYTLARQPSNPVFIGVTLSSMTLSWNANENPAGTRYGVSRSSIGFSVGLTTFYEFNSNLFDSQVVFVNLAPETTYYFNIWSYNGDAVPTLPIQVSTRTAPVVFRGTATSPTSIYWSWTLPLGTTVAGDTLLLKHGSDSSIAISTPLAEGTSFYLETGLAVNQEYNRVLVASRPAVGEFFATHPLRRYTLANPPTSYVIYQLTSRLIQFSIFANGNPQGTRYGLQTSTISIDGPWQFVRLLPSLIPIDFDAAQTGTAETGFRWDFTDLTPETTYYLRTFFYNGNRMETVAITTGIKTPAEPAVVISEFSHDSSASAGGENDDWIELYNPNPFDINLWGWSIQRKDSSGNFFMQVIGGAYPATTDVIPASGYYLITRNDANSTLVSLANVVWNGLDLANDHQTIFLVRNNVLLTTTTENGTHIADRIAYSNLIPPHASVLPEGTALNSSNGTGRSFERKASSSSTNLTLQPGGAEEFQPNSYDSNDNANDFVQHQNAFRIVGIPGNPQNANDKHFTPIIFTAPPLSPAGFSGVALGVSSISWSWNDVLFESSYAVKSAVNNAILSGALAAETSGWIETGLSANTSYFRYVTASNQAGSSPNSNTALVYTLSNPPTNFKTVSVGPDRILVEWNSNSNPSYTRYGLSRSTDNFVVNITTVVNFASALTDTSYLFTGLSQFTTYYLRVWAYNQDQKETNFVSVSTVTELIVLVGSATSVSSINWSWQLIPGSTDTAVLMQLKNGNDQSILIANLGTGVTFYSETGLATNQEYFRILTAVNGAGTQVFASNIARRYTAAQAPANLAITSVFTTTVSFSWNANGNPSGTRYGASFSTNSNFAVPVSTFLDFNSNHTALAASIGNLNPNTDYYFRVWAYNGDGVASVVVSTNAKTDPLVAVLFSEFSYDSDSAAGGETNDWVELYNPNNLSVNLTGWSLQRKDSSGNYFKRDLSGIIPASGYYLIVRNDASNAELRGLANELWTDLNLPEDHQTLFLVNTTNLLTSLTETGTSVIDRVGYSNLIPAPAQVVPEGTALNSNSGAGKSYERKASSSSTNLTMQPGGSQEFQPNSYDSNNNADDFVQHTNNFRIMGIPGLPQNANDKHFTPIIFSTPAIPANFGGTVLGVSSISWSWNDVLGESFYRVRMATNTATILSGNLLAETTSWIETGLLPNTSYQRVVTAGNSSGESGVSNSSLTYTLAVPPTNFALVSVSPTSILVQWASQGNPNYTRYGLSRSTDDFNLNITTVVNFSGGLTDTSYQFTGLVQSTTYQLRIWAYNQEQKQTSFVTLSTRTQTISFTGIATSTNSIRWNWLAVSGANNYRVKYGLDTTVAISSFLASGTTTWDEKNLDVNRDYYRVVVASNVTGEFFTSNIERIYTLAQPPTGFTLTGVFDSTITFKWSANGNPAGTRYGAAYSTNPAFSVAVTTFLNFASEHTALNSSVQGLVPSTTYYFRIWAYNGDGIEAIPPAFSTVTMPSAMVLISEFSFNSSTDSSGEFNDWVELYNPNSFPVNLTEWSLQKKDNSGNFLRKNLQGVIPAKSFYLIVRDHAQTDATLKSIADELWTDLALPADHQTLFLVSNQVLLTTVTQTGLAVVDRVGYSSIIPAHAEVVPEGTALISQNNAGKSFERKAFESSVSTNLQPGGTHEFSENRYDSNNNTFDFVTHSGQFRITGIPGLPQNSQNRFDQVIATSVPNLVQNFTGVAQSTSSILWGWSDVLGEGLYRVKLATNTAHSVSPNLVADTTFWLETGLKANSTYFRVVRASNTLGEGAPSNSAIVFTLARTPTNFRLVEVFATSVTLAWNENLNPDWTRFGLSRSTYADFSQAVSTFVNFAANLTTTTATAVNLLPSSTYYFRVWAYNGDQIETIFLTLSTKTAPGIIPKVVISEFSHDSLAGAGGEQDDWVELYNPTGLDIDLNGWSLQTKDVFNVFKSTPLKGTIPAGAFYLVVGANANASLRSLANLVWNDLSLPNDHQTIYLSNEKSLLTTLTETGFSVVDRVAYSSSVPAHPNVTPEGTALIAQEGASFERKANANSTSLTMRPGGSDELSGNSYDTGNNATDFVTHISPYRFENIPGQPQNSQNIDNAPVDVVKPKISHTPLSTRQLFRTPILIDVQVTDGKISDFDGLGSIVTIRGQVRKAGKPETAVWMEFFPPPDGAPTYIGQADITVLVQNPSEGIEYFIEAVDSGMNVKRFPNPLPDEWQLVKPQEEGKPEQKVITPSNPELVFGQEVEEAVIRDTFGNVIWRGSSNGSSVIVWKGTDDSGQSIEIGPYMYEIKTKSGEKKYGVVVIIK